MTQKKIQYTLRDIPQDTDARIREVAEAEDISLNQAALQALRRGLGGNSEPLRYRNLAHLVHDDDKVDTLGWEKALSEMDHVHADDWS